MSNGSMNSSAEDQARQIRDELARHDAEVQQLLTEIDMALSTDNLKAATGALRQVKRQYLQASELIGRYLGASAR